MIETIKEISQEIDLSPAPEQIEAQYDPETGKITEFHRDTFEKTA